MPTPPFQDQHLLKGFEGKLYIADIQYQCTIHTDTHVLLAEKIREPKYSYQYANIDATMRVHKGTKAYTKGVLDISIAFTLPIVKNDNGSYPTDTALMMECLLNRNKPITIFMLDEQNGKGIWGDFELYGGEKSEADDDLQAWDVTAYPSAVGRGVDKYEATNQTNNGE
jgi:hypothetical protein